MEYGHEVSELLNEGWSYEDVVEWCAFVLGEDY